MNYTPEQIAAVLDFAVLHPMTTPEYIQNEAAFCNKHNIKSVCVASINVGIAVQYHPCVSSVIGFPHGNIDPKAKLREAERAILFGAKELDVVINYGRFLAGDYRMIQRELSGIIEMAHNEGVLVKAILETCHYPRKEIIVACQECVAAKVDFVKTSTGFSRGGATLGTVQTMLDAVAGSGIKVKASSGIHNYQDIAMYLDMGVSRIEASRYHELLSYNEVDKTIVEKDEPNDQTRCPGYDQCTGGHECTHPQNLPCGL